MVFNIYIYIPHNNRNNYYIFKCSRKKKMSEDIYSQFLRAEVQESANATFTVGNAILTGASVNRVGGQNIALEIHAIGVGLSHPEDLPSSGGVENIAFALSTRDDLSGMPELNDEHVIFKNKTEVRAGATTYLPLVVDKDVDMPHYIEFKHPLLISHPKIYPYILSTNSTVQGIGRIFIMFTYVLLDADLAIEALESYR